jgi:hypothetical protein
MPGPVDYTWTGSNGTAWSSTIFPTIRNVRGTSAAPTIQTNAGRMVTDGAPPENCRIIAATADTFDNFDLTVSARTADADSLEIGFRAGSNVDAGSDPDNGYVFQMRMTDGIFRFLTIDNSDFVDQQADSASHDDNVWRKYRVWARGTRLKAKWWLATDTEPGFWKIDVIDNLYAFTSGRIFLGMWNNDANVEATAEWDDFHLEEVVPPPPGIYLPETLADALYIGDATVLAAFRGDSEIVVP